MATPAPLQTFIKVGPGWETLDMRRSIPSSTFICIVILLLASWSIITPCRVHAAGNNAPAQPGDTPVVRARLIIDNDFGGDPDGLFALAHHLLSPTMDIRGVIGSINFPSGFYGPPGSATYASEVATNLLKSMHLDGKVTVFDGANSKLSDIKTPVPSDGARLIVREAMRDDTKIPLCVVCGAGLTDIASAFLMEPRIAHRIRLIWIGGPEYPGLANPPPGPKRQEYNLGIDPIAAQVIFNDSDIPLWQVPRNAYRQSMVSYAYLRSQIRDKGELGHFLMASLDGLRKRANGTLGETYILGDSPLVLLTALQSSWEADPSSSQYTLIPAPKLDASGTYQPNPAGRQIRVYTNLDVRLMFEDLYAKIAEFSAAEKHIAGDAAPGLGVQQSN
jgi:purine nucleosidase